MTCWCLGLQSLLGEGQKMLGLMTECLFHTKHPGRIEGRRCVHENFLGKCTHSKPHDRRLAPENLTDFERKRANATRRTSLRGL